MKIEIIICDFFIFISKYIVNNCKLLEGDVSIFILFPNF